LEEPERGLPVVDLEPSAAERIGRRTRRAFLRAHAAERGGPWRVLEQRWIHRWEPPLATCAAAGLALWAAVAAAAG
jgi:hypothetical protein